MSFAEYVGGLAVWLVVAGSAGGAAALLVRRRLGHLRGAPRVLAFGLLLVCGTLISYLVPGILGVLARGTVIVTALVLLLVVAGLTRRPDGAAPRPDDEERAEGAAPLWAWVLAAASVAALLELAVAALIERAPVAARNVDAMNFHLPGPGTWIHTDSLWGVHQFLPDLAHGNYPQNGDLLLTSVLLPWHDDAFARLVGLPLLALAGLAVYAIAIELGSPRPAAIVWAVAFAALPAAFSPAGFEVLTDPLMLAGFATGVLFLLRHWRTGEAPELLLGGVGLGIAFGTKWYGVSTVIAVVALWAIARLARDRRAGPVLRAGLLLCAVIALAGGFWLLRNLVDSGNPLFPVKVAPLGVTIFDAPIDQVRESAGWTIAHYLGEPGILADYIAPALWRTLGIAGPAFAIVLGAVLIACYSDWRAGRLDLRIPALAVTSLVLVAIYLNTPYTALGAEGAPDGAAYNVRYLLPALVFAAPLAAWLAGRGGAWNVVSLVAGAAAVLDGVRRSLDHIGTTPVLQAGAVLIAVALAALAFAALYRRAPTARRGLVVATAAGAAAVVLVAGGQKLQTKFNSQRYEGSDPTFDWVNANAPSGRRVGIVGRWSVTFDSPVWPMFGPRIGNRVHYVGEFRDGMLRDFGTRQGFLRGLRDQRDELLLISRGDPPRPKVVQQRWARSAGLTPVAASDRFILYRVPAELAQ